MGRNSKEYNNKLKSILKEDLIKFYINELRSIPEIAELYEVKDGSIYKLLKQYDINRTKEEIQAARENTNISKYGCKNVFQNEAIKEKCGDTKFELYGDRNYRDLDKLKQTNLERYGVEHNWASKDPKLNGRATCYEEFGGKENFYKYIHEKGCLTKLAIYGDANYNNREKAENTCIDKYGYKSSF